MQQSERSSSLLNGFFSSDIHHAFELTTGAAAIAESLALRRIAGTTKGQRQAQNPVTALPGIDVAEHPWKKMMAGKKPADEPLAEADAARQLLRRLQQHPQVHRVQRAADQWGRQRPPAYEVQAATIDLKGATRSSSACAARSSARRSGRRSFKRRRPDRQRPLPARRLRRHILFHVRQRNCSSAAVEPFIEEARTKFGKRAARSKSDLSTR